MALTDVTDLGALEALAQQIDVFLDTTVTAVTLEAAKEAVKRAEVRRFRDLLLDELDALERAQVAKRACETAVADDRTALAEAMAEADWQLGGNFEVRGNKTYLAIDADGAPIAEDAQRSLTADEKKAWIARHTERIPAVAEAKKHLALTEEAGREAADRVVITDKRLQAARHLLDASVVELETYRIALAAPQRKEHTR